MTRKIKIAITSIFIFISATCNHIENTPSKDHIGPIKAEINTECDSNTEDYKSFDKYFTNLKEKNGFNGAVLISRKNKVIFKKAYGYSNFKTKELLSTKSAFQIASVSKQFTAFAILSLYDKGLLKLTDTIQRFYPEFPYHGITIQNLLNHRSGLCNYIYFIDPIWKDQSKILSLAHVMALFKQLQPPCYLTPNRKYNYNNTNYIILAAIVEKVSKMKFDVFMKKNIFEPLGMYHTFVYNPLLPPDPTKIVSGYETRNNSAEFNYLDGVPGDKDVYTTVEDMFLWDQAWYSNKLVSSKTMALAFEPGSPELKTKNYGFGWRISHNTEGDTLVFHRGWWHGFRSYFMRNISKHECIVIFTNIASEKSHIRVKEITDVLNPHQDEAEKENEEDE